MKLSSRLRVRSLVKSAGRPIRGIAGLVTALLMTSAIAFGQDVSAWSSSHKSQARLLAGGGTAETRLAALEFVMEHSFKTYWRHPGESGLPPSFDWSASANVERVEVLWPAPHRFKDAIGFAYGYSGSLILPLKVVAKDPDRPVRLAGRVDYGVCREICIPAHAELDLPLPAGRTDESSRIEAALAKVPREVEIGATGPLAVLGVDIESPDRIQVRIRAQEGSEPVLFVEAPDGWYLDPSEQISRADGADTAGSGSFTVSVAERPAEITAAIPLRLTLVAGGQSIETTVSLPATSLR